jgi:anti-sigma B factor antagonist
VEFNTEDRDGICVLRVGQPRIDAYGAGELKARLLQLAEGKGAIVLDLGAVRFMDSSGLAALIAAHKRTGTGRLTLAALQPQVRSVLDLTGLSKVLDISPSVDEAVESLR